MVKHLLVEESTILLLELTSKFSPVLLILRELFSSFQKSGGLVINTELR
jgi:hypothetical protein